MFSRTHSSIWRRVAGKPWSMWRHVEDGTGVTVFIDDENRWKWVYQGDFSKPFVSQHEAMRNAEEELGLT